MIVHILTYCKSQSSLYGNCLVFKTLRIGFPNAKVFVCDNASPIELSKEIKVLAEENDCHFVRLKKEIPHHYFLDYCIANNNTNEPIIFLDPDICFWKNCEDWKFNSLLAGRLIPKFYDDFSECITHPRIHTSFLWVSNTNKLLKKIDSIDKFEYQPFIPFMYFIKNKWFRFDTMAMLYSLFEKQIESFSKKELNSYDHLFCGTHLDLVKDTLPQVNETHKQAKENYKSIRGIWEKQEKYFNDRKVINE